MFEFGGSGVVNGRWDGREPIFRDVPLEQSEWATLHAMLAQVNTLKAELVRVQYEAARTAYQNYHTAVARELVRYNQQREIDAEYNAQIREYRARLLSQVEAVRQRWQPELDALRRQLDEARLRAYRLAARAGVQLREDPEAGLEIVNPSQSTGAPPQEPVSSETRSDSPPFVARLWRRLPQQVAYSTAPVPTAVPTTPTMPLTPEEAAYAQRLPTNHAPAAPLWLPWVAAVAVGLAIGQILLAAMGHPLSAWQSPAFWVASVAGVLVGVVWYRVVWSLSRALTELYYLYDWGAQKARRAAWLGGGVLIVVLLLPLLLLLTAIGRLPAAGAADSLLLAMLTLVLIIPLLGLALVGGYFYGRAAVIHNAIQSKVTAALREQRHAEHAQARGAAVASEPSEGNHSPHGANGEIEESAPKSPSNHLAPPPPSEPSCPPPLLADVREAVAEVRAQHKAYLRLQAMRQEELLPYERLLSEMQPRPIYDYLPPQAEQRIQALYRQWLNAYATFLDYVGEAVRECKDGEQLQQRITEFKQALLR